MQIKDSVRLAALLPQTVLAIMVANSVWGRVGQTELTVTSCNDGAHAGKPAVKYEARDPHYSGRAADLRIKDVPVNLRGQVVDAFRAALGPSYRVLWESQGTDNEHVHVQYEGAI